jgi:hypothetical protein
MNYSHLLLYMTRVSQQCRALGFSENPSSLTKKMMRKGAKYRMLIPTHDLPVPDTDYSFPAYFFIEFGSG